jgi:DNA recombination protein RmuC
MMGPIWLLLGLAVGGTVGALIVRRALTRRLAELLMRVADGDVEQARVAARCSALERDLLRAEGDLNTSVGRLQVELDGERKASAEKIGLLTQAREDLVAQVKQSAGEALDARAEQLLKTLEAHLATAQTKSGADLEKRQKAVEQVVAPIKDTLTRMDKTLEKVELDRRRTHAELSERLRGVVQAENELRTEAGALVRALRQPHTRGRWGEMHLRRLTEVAGMSDLCDFTEQAHVDDDGGVVRPDMVVHLPGDKDIVVDSKAPLAPYLDACEATDDAARAAHMKLYARGLRAHVKRLASKNYASQFESTPDFVVLYLPGEHFFSAAVETDPALIEDALRGCVLIATPTTLLVMLKTVAHTWQQEKVAQEAQAIAGLGRQLYERLITYLTHVDVVGKRLNSSVDAHNKAVASLEGMVLPAARRFPDLGAVAIDKQLPSPRLVSSTAREVQARELASPEHEAPQLPSPAGEKRNAA